MSLKLMKMKIYFYTGIDANGKQITSQILAKNKSEATIL